MSHSSSLKARRKRQRIKKLIDVEAKRAKRLAKQAAAGPKKEKVKKVRVKKEKVKPEGGAPKEAKKPKPTKEELGRQESKKSPKEDGKKGAA